MGYYQSIVLKNGGKTCLPCAGAIALALFTGGLWLRSVWVCDSLHVFWGSVPDASGRACAVRGFGGYARSGDAGLGYGRETFGAAPRGDYERHPLGFSLTWRRSPIKRTMHWGRLSLGTQQNSQDNSMIYWRGFGWCAGLMREHPPGTYQTAGWGIIFPMWAAFALSMLPVPFCLHAFVVRDRRQHRRRLGLCEKCSYDLRAHKPGDRCPECGTVIPTETKCGNI